MPIDLDEARAVLERTPATLDTLLGGLPDAWLHADEGEGTFSPHDVVGHLISGEEHDWLPRVRHILDRRPSVPFEPFDRFAFREAYADLDTAARLARFAELRRSALAQLRDLELGPAHLDAVGTHPALGTVTLGQLLATWVAHDLSHLAQIARVLARRYRDAVGPWRESMSLLATSD